MRICLCYLTRDRNILSLNSVSLNLMRAIRSFILQIYNFRRMMKNSKRLLVNSRALRLHWVKARHWQEVHSPCTTCPVRTEKMRVNKQLRPWYSLVLPPITINRNMEVENWNKFSFFFFFFNYLFIKSIKTTLYFR